MTIAFDDTESSYYIRSESHAVNKAYAFPLKYTGILRIIWHSA